MQANNSISQLRQHLILTILILLLLLTQLTTTMYLPSLTFIAREFSVTAEQAQNTVSVFFLGLSLSYLFYGPLSDCLGRLRVLVFGLVVYVFASICCATATSISQLTISRFFQGIGGGAGVALSYAIIFDIFGTNRLHKPIGILSSAAVISPLIGPLIGGAIYITMGWRSIFIILTFAGAILLLSLNILNIDILKRSRLNKKIAFLSLFSPLLQDKLFLSLTLFQGISISILLVFLSQSTFIVINKFNYSVMFFSFALAICGFFFIFGVFIGKSLRRFGGNRVLDIGTLVVAISGGLVLFNFLLKINNIYFYILSIQLFSLGVGIYLPTIIETIVNRFPKLAGTTSSLINFTATFLTALFNFSFSLSKSSENLHAALYFMMFSILLSQYYLIRNKLWV